jgi:tRNA(Ile)-lysidine synthase
MGRSNKTLPASGIVSRVQQSVQGALEDDSYDGSYLLAVSGGVDSMVLLDAAAATIGHDRLLVATFDHGSGPAAARAASRVLERAAELGISAVRGESPVDIDLYRPRQTEAAWRQARWSFLKEIAQRDKRAVVTAHTKDDQVETVFMRALRNAGPRGLSALYAASTIVRPLLGYYKDELLQYAEEREITFIVDPFNFSRRYLRTRVRYDLLPLMRAQNPDFDAQWLDLATRAADWRTQMDQVAATFKMMSDTTGSFYIPLNQFAGYPAESLRVLWPALAARAGIVMDRRGTHRLAEFTIEGEFGQCIQLSGDIEVRRRRDALVIRRRRAHD